MSALDFRQIPPRSDTRGFCENGCQVATNGTPAGPKLATVEMACLGHPLGQFCDGCKKTMQRVWHENTSEAA